MARKSKLTEIEKAEQSRQKAELIRGRRSLFFLTIVIWAIVFLIMRDALKIGGNPFLNFILMFGLLLIIFFFVRIGAVRFKTAWSRLKRTVKSLFKKR
jgi:hypothetical protein